VLVPKGHAATTVERELRRTHLGPAPTIGAIINVAAIKIFFSDSQFGWWIEPGSPGFSSRHRVPFPLTKENIERFLRDCWLSKA